MSARATILLADDHVLLLEAVRRLRGELPRTRVVFLTVNEDPQMAAEAFALGASGYVLKSSTALELDQAIGAALAGRRYLSKRIAGGDPGALPAASPTNRLERLTLRERDVLKLLA